MTGPAKVSVLLPAKDCGARLAPAVKSALGQTHDHLELIVIDDGSQDGSVEALDKSDPRLKIIRNRGAGIVDALNAGAAAATGAYYARMDGDDVCHPERFAKQMSYLAANPHIGIAATQVEVVADYDVGEGYRLYEEWVNSLVAPRDIAREIFVESPLPHPTVMMRAEVFENLGGYRDMGWAEDYDMWLRAYERGVGMGKVAARLLRWTDSGGRLSKTCPKYSKESFMRARAHFLARTLLRGRNAVIWGAGVTGRALGKLLIAEGARISDFIDVNPRRAGGTKLGRPVHPPEWARTTGGFIVAAVAARGAREEIRDFLDAAGKKEGADYVLAA